jgi:hypothetical protein
VYGGFLFGWDVGKLPTPTYPTYLHTYQYCTVRTIAL